MATVGPDAQRPGKVRASPRPSLGDLCHSNFGGGTRSPPWWGMIQSPAEKAKGGAGGDSRAQEGAVSYLLTSGGRGLWEPSLKSSDRSCKGPQSGGITCRGEGISRVGGKGQNEIVYILRGNLISMFFWRLLLCPLGTDYSSN